MKNKCIVYLGDFDLRNENVQAHLVKNNAKILNTLGYTVAFVGINRDITEYKKIADLSTMDLGGNIYLELPNTLNFKGLLGCREIFKIVIEHLNLLLNEFDVEYVISYQAPTYAEILRRVAHWCWRNRIKYIVNCADLPIFDSQPFLRRMVMKWNWHSMHKINHKYADGVISVSKKISDFYDKEGRPSIIVPPLFDEVISECYAGNDVACFLYAGTPFVTLDKAVNPDGMKDRLDKVVDLFIELSKRDVNYKFVVVGLTKDAYVTCVPRHKQALTYEDKIFFLGRKSHNETLQLLTMADFMINLRDRNLMTEAGLSTKVVESVSVGTPVVMNSIGDTFDYLQDGVSGFALPEQLHDCIAVLEKLCEMTSEERSSCKDKCRACGVFSLSMYQDKIEHFLKQVNS